MLRMAIGLTAILAPLQLFIGDQHGLNTLKHQPIKIAAMEAHWDGSKPGDFHIFAWPDEKAGVNHFEISIPNGASLILTHQHERPVPGLEQRAGIGAAAGEDRVLRLPHHAGDRLLHDRGGAARRLPVVARHAVRDALVSARHGAMLVARLRRGDRRLGGDRERTPALDRRRRCCAPPTPPRRCRARALPARWRCSSSSTASCSRSASITSTG